MTARALYPSSASGRTYKFGNRFMAARPSRSTIPPATTPASTPAKDTDPVQDQHLLRRATYGATGAALAEVAAVGRAAWLDRQLDPASLPDPAGDAIGAHFPTLAYSASTARAKLPAFTGDLMNAMLGNTMGRSVWSTRQLHEVMAAFWNDHLHIVGMFFDAWDTRHRFDLDVIRKHALGSFAQMLQDGIRHPAMQRYLDQNNSRANNLNENLGRELLELHTVGAYTEADVLASSRMLTGLSIGDDGEFLYRPDYHHVGPLTILGWSHSNSVKDGQKALTDYLNFLARHPSTAARIARKLAVRFIADDPSIDLVNRIAKVYLDNDTQIAPVLKFILTSPDFQAAVGKKVRTPQEDIYAQLRVLGFGVPTSAEELQQLYWSLNLTGHAPMNWAPPNGFPDTPAHWATPTTALGRLTLHMDISAGWWPQFTGYPTANGARSLAGLLPAALPATHGELVQALAQRLLFAPVSTQVRDAIVAHFGKKAADPLTKTAQFVGWQLPYVVTLLFDSPAHAVR